MNPARARGASRRALGLALTAVLSLAGATAAFAQGGGQAAPAAGSPGVLAGVDPMAPQTAASSSGQPAGAPTAAPAAVTPAQATATSLAAAQQTLTQLQAQAQTASGDARLAALGAQAASVEAAAQAAASARSGDIAALDRALQRYGPRGRAAATAGERRQRASLLARRAVATAQLGQARSVAAAASNTFNLIAERRRTAFSARVLARTASPISPGFWTSLANAGGGDLARLQALALEAERTASEAPEPKGILSAGAGLLIALVLLFPARWGVDVVGRRIARRAGGQGGLTRTGRALWVAGADTLLPGLAAIALRLGAEWGGLLSDRADGLFDAAVVAVTWGAAILALGRALATDAEADARLLSLPEHAAARVRFSLWAVAVVTGAGFLLTRLNYVVGASVAATIAANCAVAVAYAAAASLILVSLSGGKPSTDAGSAADEDRSPVWTLVSLVLTVAIAATLAAIIGGYTTLAALIAGQIFWLSVVAASAYLLLRFVDDLCGALFSADGWAARALHGLFGLRRPAIAQAGVLLSAGMQILVLLAAFSLALTPFGQSGELLLGDIGRLAEPFHIGSAVISPAAIATGVGSLAIGLALAHVVRGWVVRRYLPVTPWDAGVRNSVSTGVGYLGVGVALLCALAAMGLGFQQIALIAGALSVGIGFGLQQVVQNFASGVILLVERPVKVGDWIKVDDIEGDVRRIRVRATEIRTFDQSTLIVPNSDLITKAVQNKTLGEPRSRITLQLSIANPSDARKAADLLLATARAKATILKDPAPAVYIDSVAAGGAVNFNGYFYVGDPRDAYRTRSELYFEILEAFEKNGVAFVAAPAS
jgi:potassium-dependent mechanosensitive channel